MKKTGLLVLICLITNLTYSQVTLTLQPDSVNGKDAWITSNATGNNYGNYPNFAAIAWSSGGDFISRGLMDFDLSQIPANATISSAKLSLYCNTTSDHPQLHSSLSGSNSCYLQRITSGWSEFNVNWSNQPTTTTLNQVTLAKSDTSTQDYLNIDVLNLIRDMHANSSGSFGIMIKLITEVKFRSLIFANSDHLNASKRPKLEIIYTPGDTNVSCVTIKPNGTAGKDAWITSNAANNNYGVYPNFAAIAWSSGGDFISRGLIDFDMSSIPANAILKSAKLNLYCNTTSDHPQLHSSLSGSNACVLQRITSAWTENLVNWNNQPTTTSVNEVSLAQSTSQTQDYLNLDVLKLVQDMRLNSSTSFGMMIKLVTEIKFRSLIFANSDHTDSTKWPSITICYTLPSGLQDLTQTKNLDFNVFPNPITEGQNLQILNPDGNGFHINITDIQGKLILSKEVIKGETQALNLNENGILNKGTYIIHISGKEQNSFKKLIIQ